MLYELYKNFYFNFYDNLIIWLLPFSLIIIFKFIKLLFLNMRFTSIKHALALCASRLGPKRSLRLSAPLAFTNTDFTPMIGRGGEQLWMNSTCAVFLKRMMLFA